VDAPLIRIFSDVHYGDLSSRVQRLDQLAPLARETGALVVNGDLLDTRPGPDPRRTRDDWAAVTAFFARSGVPTTFVTGNHDPDISSHHVLELADRRVLLTHGDILFDAIVPWGRDAATIRRMIRAAFAAIPEASAPLLERRLAALRQVAAVIPQRHQSERSLAKYLWGLASDTLWPPHRALHVLRAWRELPTRAAAFAQAHRPEARFILVGHTHRPGLWRTPSGVVVINTGSFGRPFGGLLAELTGDTLRVRRIALRGGQFHPGEKVAELPLA